MMRHSRKIVGAAGLISMLACACMAQNRQGAAVPQIEMRSGQMSYFSMGPGPMAGSLFQTVTGMPYSAEELTEHVQTLADGTNITQTNVQSKIYRDSEGRTRTEHTISPPGGSGQTWAPSFVEIADPVAGYRYTLNERSHTASRIRMLWSPGGLSHSFKRAPGVSATGTRSTTTFPEGFFGNDRPIVTTSETWVSPELKRVVLMKSSDPRYGETTMRLTNIVRAEPDRSLFQIPEDYTVRDGQEGISFNPPGGTQ